MKRSYDKAEDIPEAFKDEYVQDGDVWILKVDGGAIVDPDVPKKLDTFRTNNRSLNSELESLKSEVSKIREEYAGIDPKMYAKIKTQIDSMKEDEEKALMAAGKIDEVVTRRTKAAIADTTEKFKAKSAAYDELKGKYDNLHSEHTRSVAVRTIRGLIGEKDWRLKPGAEPILEDKVGKDWTLDENGKPTPARQDLLGEDGSPITEKEYVTRELLEKCSFMFEPAKGGGAPGSKDKPGGSGKIQIDRDDSDSKSKNIDALADGKAELV